MYWHILEHKDSGSYLFALANRLFYEDFSSIDGALFIIFDILFIYILEHKCLSQVENITHVKTSNYWKPADELFVPEVINDILSEASFLGE